MQQMVKITGLHIQSGENSAISLYLYKSDTARILARQLPYHLGLSIETTKLDGEYGKATERTIAAFVLSIAREYERGFSR